MKNPVVLCILDGWGHRENGKGNAVAEAQTPYLDKIFHQYPHTLLQASEEYVGLPEGQMGNSEVGHMNIGAGRVVLQDLPRINKEIQEDTLKDNKVLQDFIAKLKMKHGTCHLMGLLSPGGVHSHQKHMEYLARALSQAGIPVAIHAFLDGRDTPPQSAKEFVTDFVNNTGLPIATLSGRYYAMDRDNRWDRIEKDYNALVCAKADSNYDTPLEAIEESYSQGITDEFLIPCIAKDYSGMKDGDGVLMANFRTDRAREILQALALPDFDKFERQKVIDFTGCLGMVSYSEELAPYFQTLSPPTVLMNTLGEILSKEGKQQLRIAETEKYAHVTFFFNGGEEKMFKGEDRILIASPKVATYDLKPEMSANEVTDALVEALDEDKYDFVVVNYANLDMVGHTGIEKAAIQAVETIDHCLQRLSEKVLAKNGSLLITADHGNAEVMINEKTGKPHTAHTLNPVPLVLVSEPYRNSHLKDGVLADIAPTILDILKLNKPSDMTGTSLLNN